MAKLNVESMKLDFLVASSGKYVYKKFRESESLYNFARAASVRDIITYYDEHVGVDDKSLEDVVYCYAMLVSASYKKRGEALMMFKEIDITNLVWGEEIKNMSIEEIRIDRHQFFPSTVVERRSSVNFNSSSSEAYTRVIRPIYILGDFAKDENITTDYLNISN